MFVDITIKLPYLPQGKNSLYVSPVSVIKEFELKVQLEMWLLIAGLLTVQDTDPDFYKKFEFIFNSQPLTSLELLKDGDTVEVKLVSKVEPLPIPKIVEV